MARRIDSEKFTLPIYYEFKNPNNQFKIGTLVNIENDMLAKYMHKFMTNMKANG